MAVYTKHNNDMYKNAVGYIRVSDQSQVDGESLDTQKNSIVSFAAQKNFQLIEFFSDEGRSAKTDKRPGLQGLLKYCANPRNKVEYVIVYKMSRMTRNMENYFTEINMFLAARGVKILSSTEPIDDSPLGQMFQNFSIMNAQFDNQMKSAYTTDNMKALAMQGWWLHGPVLGYDSVRIENASGKLRPTLEPNGTSKLIRKVLERFGEADITQAELNRYATAQGLRSRTGNKMTDEMMGRILRNPTYAGFVCDKFTEGELVQGQHKAIISPELYFHNQELLGRKSKAGEVHKRHNPTFVLRRLLLCHNCQKPMTGSSPRTGGGKSHSARYHCARKECRGIVRSVKADVVHDAYYEMLERVEPSEGIIKLYKELLIRQAGRENERINTALRKVRSELDDIADTRLKAIEDRVKSQDADEKKELTELVTKLDQRKIDKLGDQKDLEKKQSIQEAKIEYAVRHMNNVAKLWHDANPATKAGFQTMMFPEGVTFNSQTLQFGTEKISPLYRYAPNKKDLSEKEKSHLVTSRGIEPRLPG